MKRFESYGTVCTSHAMAYLWGGDWVMASLGLKFCICFVTFCATTYSHTNFCLFARWELRPSTMVLHSCLFVAIFSISLPVYPIFFLSFSVSLCRVFLSLPPFPFLWGFHVSDCRAMFVACFFSLCSIHLHFSYLFRFLLAVVWSFHTAFC